jgi:hypothetical protein
LKALSQIVHLNSLLFSWYLKCSFNSCDLL